MTLVLAVMPLGPPRRDRPTEAALELKLVMSAAEVTPTGLADTSPHDDGEADEQLPDGDALRYGPPARSPQEHEDRKVLFGMILARPTRWEHEALESLMGMKGRCHRYSLDSLKGLAHPGLSHFPGAHGHVHGRAGFGTCLWAGQGLARQ